jgi:translation initiation factor IF-2
LPKLAEPPPPPKAPAASAAAAEAPAQKPEVRFSRDIIEKRQPLQEHLRQHAEEKKKKKRPDGTEELVEETEKRPVGKGPGGKATAGMGLLSERKQRQARRVKGSDLIGEEEEAVAVGTAPKVRPQRGRGRRVAPGAAPAKTTAEIELPITVRGLSAAIGRTAPPLIKALYQRGVMATINSNLDEETALDLAMEFGVDLRIKRERDIEQELAASLEEYGEEETRVQRPPIVTILGHVDHGKTTLLDKIRSANVAAGEVGGITQHIAAYQVEHGGQKITFLDTPGHAAFAEMRARGANVTDIAVLVVAANDGVMPQTIEALNHAKAANVPIVVALNKIDLPERNETKVLQELAAQNVLAAEWGGDTEVVRTSGTTGQGIDQLLETLLTISELRELQATVDRPAHGVCLEAFLDEGRGVIAWLIVQEGKLRKGDIVLCGSAFGRIRNIYNDLDQEIEEAGPSTPVKIAGLDSMPGAGDQFFVMPGFEEARSVANMRRERGREKTLSERGRPRTLQDIVNAAQTGEVQDLPVIVKADTPGSVEALKGELLKFQHPEVRVNILHEGVGGVNESDV